MKEILEAVMERLQEEVGNLRYIAEDWGQLDYYHDTPPVKFPCALVSMNRLQFESETRQTRRARMNILIRVADAPAVSATMAAPEQHTQQAFAIFDLMERIGNCLYGFGGDAFNELEQQEITRYNREDAVREYAMTFTTEYLIETDGSE